MRVIAFICIIAVCIAARVFAQERLSVDQAIAGALSTNKQILVSQLLERIAGNDVTPGNAGFLPKVDLNASASLAYLSTEQHLSSGVNTSYPGIWSASVSAGLVGNWTVYNGQKMFATYDKLVALRRIAELRTKLQAQDVAAAVIIAYYDIVQQKQLMKALGEAIAFSDERLKIAEKKSAIGSSAQVDVLQARIERNRQLALKLRLEQSVSTSKLRLNQVMARDPLTEFDVVDSIPAAYRPTLDDVIAKAVQSNYALLLQKQNIDVAEQMRREFEAERLPVVSVNAGYNFSLTDNSAGNSLFSRSNGPSVGVIATWNLFDGYNTDRRVENAKINSEVQQRLYDMLRMDVTVGITIAYRAYLSSLGTLALDEANYRFARENLSIALERFRIGSSTSLELLSAQSSFEDAATEVVRARYEAVLSQTELLRLSGDVTH